MEHSFISSLNIVLGKPLTISTALIHKYQCTRTLVAVRSLTQMRKTTTSVVMIFPSLALPRSGSTGIISALTAHPEPTRIISIADDFYLFAAGLIDACCLATSNALLNAALVQLAPATTSILSERNGLPTTSPSIA